MKEIVVDLRKSKEQLNESYLTSLGSIIKYALNSMFPESNTTLRIVGQDIPVRRFISALASEKKYLDSYNRYGLTDPKTYNNKYQLDSAIKAFERETGLKWPLK